MNCAPAGEQKVLNQVEKVKTGDFSDVVLASAKNDLIKEFNSSIEDVTSRGIMIGRAFNKGRSWEEQLAYPGKIEAITKEKKRPYKEPASQAYSQNTIFFVHQKKAIQSQVFFHVPGGTFETDQYPDVQGFNGYFADGFSGLVTQEIREYRSLAYSTGARYSRPALPGGKGKLIAYIGCQGDKTNDAVPVMVDLLKNMPSKPDRMEALRRSLQLKVVTNFPDFRQVPFRVFDYKLGGFTADPHQQAYEVYADLEMEDIEAFYQKNIQSKPYVITIYGDKKRIDMNKLKPYGEIIELETEDFIKF